ncbi:MAG TPA: hypothetical protein VN026_17225 [Bacteroidia bacterium]|jgi:hypothetical protein|nr:hypothetical protein [Bacteroidia bacterium]
MKKYFFPLLFFVMLSSISCSQTLLDSLKLKFQKDSAHNFRFKKIRPCFTIDQRNSWIKNEKGLNKVPVTINGIQLGVVLKEKHTLGLGFYTMNQTSQKPVKISDQNNKITYQDLLLKYATVYYQYVIFDTRFFEMDLPLEVGVGNYIYNLKDETQTALLWREAGPLKITGGGVNIVLKPVRWIGISGMAGYRIVTFNKKTNLNFNGIYYSYGVWIDLRQIYRDIKFYGFMRPKYRKKVKALSASKS